MEQRPEIIMKCPKCAKEFSANSSYCEACSVMLEPVEVDVTVILKKDIKKPLLDDVDSDKTKIADVKIDVLKADIETRFVVALFHERRQLKKRLKEKEKALSELKGKKLKMENSVFLAKAEKKESDISEIKAKISKLESILYNLKKKIEADISDLNSRFEGIRKPGLWKFITREGRYYRMLASEIRTKNALMDVMLERRSSGYFNRMRLKRLSLIIFFPIVVSLLIFWYVFTPGFDMEKVPHIPRLSGVIKKGDFAVKEMDIIGLLEDIRLANLNKDLGLWESRYSKEYLKLKGKKENQMELWRRFDFRSLKYSVDNIKMRDDGASADITWEIELLSKEKTEAKIFSQRLYADFVIEKGRLKIGSVRKQEE